jgi:hypothetical protein
MRREIAAATASLSLLLVACGTTPPPAASNIDPGGGEGGSGATTGEGGGPAAGTQTLQGALAEFGACMSMDAFVRTGTYKLHSALTKDNQQCGSCHATGDGGAWITEDLVAMFDGNATFPGVMRLVTGTVDERGNFVTLVPANRYIEKGIEPCLEGSACHPRFTLNADMQNAVVDFVKDSLDRWTSKNCGAAYQPPDQN